jgi:DNA-directed RNA polymerase subunit E'/Rpb7
MAISNAKRADASGAFIEIDFLHSLIHQGELFEVNDVDNDVDMDSYWYVYNYTELTT